MLKAFFSQTGGEIILPDAVEMVAGTTDATIHFVDQDGRVLAIFRREDVAVVTNDVLFAAQLTDTDGKHANAPVT